MLPRVPLFASCPPPGFWPLAAWQRVGTRLDNGTQDARYELTDHLGKARVVFYCQSTFPSIAEICLQL